MAEFGGENSGTAKTAGTFKYNGAVSSAVVALLMVAATSAVLWFVDTGERRPVSIGSLFFLAVCVFNSIMFTIAALAKSDVIVDEKGISRRFMGLWTWKRMRWDNIRKIGTTPMPFPLARGQTVIRTITIYPRVPPRFRLLPGGRSGFLDSVPNWKDLAEAMNYYIANYHIEVVLFGAKKGGESTTHI